MLRKHAMKFGIQWDHYLSGVLWVYRNTLHEGTKEKPSYLLFSNNCHSPTEAAFLPTEPIEYIDVEEYREEVTFSLSSARELAASNIKTAQKRYKEQYDKQATPDQHIEPLYMAHAMARRVSYSFHFPLVGIGLTPNLRP